MIFKLNIQIIHSIIKIKHNVIKYYIIIYNQIYRPYQVKIWKVFNKQFGIIITSIFNYFIHPQISTVTNLDKLNQLQHLALGRNQLKEINYLANSKICPILNELLLYYNQLEEFPPNFSKLLLKSLWINGNKLKSFSISWCPSLEYLNISDNSILTLTSLEPCQTLASLDISFNNILIFSELLQAISKCYFLKFIKFNDNPFEKGRERCFNPILSRMFPIIQEINSEHCKETEWRLPSYSCAGGKCAYSMIQASYFIAAEQTYITRILKSGKLGFSDKFTELFKKNKKAIYYLKYLPTIHFNLFAQILLQYKYYLPYCEGPQVHQKAIQNTINERNAGRMIFALIRRKILKKRFRLRYLKKFTPKITKIQAWTRGILDRKLNKNVIKQLRKKFRKKPKINKENMATAIQAITRGFLLRRRIKQGLAKAQNFKMNIDDCPEIDIDNFLGIKEPENWGMVQKQQLFKICNNLILVSSN